MLGLSRLARFAPAAEPPWLADAVSLIERRYGEALTLAGVARAVGVHRATLAAAFRRFRRTSVGQYLRQVRVSRAKEGLVSSEAPLAEIALRSGFYDQAHFSRVFRAFTGCTPARWRSRHR